MGLEYAALIPRLCGFRGHEEAASAPRMAVVSLLIVVVGPFALATGQTDP